MEYSYVEPQLGSFLSSFVSGGFSPLIMDPGTLYFRDLKVAKTFLRNVDLS